MDFCTPNRPWGYFPRTCAALFVLLWGVAIVSQSRLAADELQRPGLVDFLGVLHDDQLRDVPQDSDVFLVAVRKPTRTFETKPYYLLVRNLPALEREVLQDAADGTWDQFDLFQAALIVEGVLDREKIAHYEKRLAEVAEEILRRSRRISRQSDSHEKMTKLVFEMLHEKILTGRYGIANTSVSAALDTGDYNCVSATILFNALVRKCRLDENDLHVFALEKSGHVLSRVKSGALYADLETTCPDWFGAANARQSAARWNTSASVATNAVPQERSVRQAAKPPVGVGEPGVPDRRTAIRRELRTATLPSRPGEKILAGSSPGDVKEPEDSVVREISDVQLVAAVYYNQGYDYWSGDRLPESIAATAKALHLDSENRNAWGNLVGAINNTALEFTLEQKRYRMSVDLLEQIDALDPGFKDLDKNRFFVYSKWLKELIEAESYDHASFVLANAFEKLPNYRDQLRLFAELIP